MTDPFSSQNSSAAASPLSSDETLGSWQGIANYMGQTVRTIQRWEKLEGLPVRRLQRGRETWIFAYKRELDLWLTRRNIEVPDGRGDPGDAASAEAEPSTLSHSRFTLRSIPPYAWIITAAAIIALGILPWLIGGD